MNEPLTPVVITRKKLNRRHKLERVIHSGTTSARKIKRANMLLLASESYPDGEICQMLCLDELPYQLVGDCLDPLWPEQGRCYREDDTYKRQGTCNLFMMFHPLAGWRHVKITEQRTARDYAQCLKDIVQVHFPTATCIRLVQDNLNTHKLSALYEAFPPKEARQLVKKLEPHSTPKHTSWLNTAETEFSVLSRQC